MGEADGSSARMPAGEYSFGLPPTFSAEDVRFVGIIAPKILKIIQQERSGTLEPGKAESDWQEVLKAAGSYQDTVLRIRGTLDYTDYDYNRMHDFSPYSDGVNMTDDARFILDCVFTDHARFVHPQNARRHEAIAASIRQQLAEDYTRTNPEGEKETRLPEILTGEVILGLLIKGELDARHPSNKSNIGLV